ncbi:MAG: hypothetical protein Q8P11_03090 [bacterium]|nr:hypothetical protein [bacterium]
MQAIQNNEDTQREQEIEGKLASLNEKAAQAIAQLRADKEETMKEMDVIEAEVDESIVAVDQLCDDLDLIDKETSGEMEELLLKSAKEIDEE